MTPKVGIIGFGMVGGALTRYFNSRNITPVIFDPLKGYEDAEALKDTDIIFVCVPTPYDAVSHGFDLRYVDSAFDVIPKNKIVVIKSTVVPGTTLAYQKKRPDLTVMFNPEFLTESRSDEDMFHPNRQIIGIVKEEDRGAAEKVLEILPAAPFVKIVAAAEAEMLKYFGNAFYALKVAYANQIFDLCQK
ncbi:MAG: UDP-glucose/GDP-mannose dehydrogenase dimerization, partial [Candidatus Magasanikbacteria bacterium]|nr:UDP-glucose/GDP-mannose dehydrogenase dimerization [Candidatus Magasanikbacteria bacterium]